MKVYSVFYPTQETQTIKVRSSSNLFEVKYEAKVMTVTFVDKSVYSYTGKGVKTIFNKLKRENNKSTFDRNRSVGKLFNKLVKNNSSLKWKKIN